MGDTTRASIVTMAQRFDRADRNWNNLAEFMTCSFVSCTPHPLIHLA
jgi:hypothetical protein